MGVLLSTVPNKFRLRIFGCGIYCHVHKTNCESKLMQRTKKESVPRKWSCFIPHLYSSQNKFPNDHACIVWQTRFPLLQQEETRNGKNGQNGKAGIAATNDEVHCSDHGSTIKNGLIVERYSQVSDADVKPEDPPVVRQTPRRNPLSDHKAPK